MFKATGGFSGFSVDDLTKAKEFYAGILGLNVDEQGAGLQIVLPGGTAVFAYPKANHEPATFTILNFEVEDIDVAVDALVSQGVQFEHYTDGDGPQTDEKGVMRGRAAGYGPNIAWFKDPAGNFLSIIEA